MTVAELIERLQELPPDWEIWATKSGQSLMTTEPGDWRTPGRRYAYVFTTGKPTLHMARRS